MLVTREKHINHYFSIATLLIVLAGAPGLAATNLAPTPPMGWNSWDSYGLTVTETEFKANVTWFHRHLQPLGWQYVVVDEGWYLQHPGQKGAAQGFVMDADGRYLVANNRFSSSGFKPLADWVHSLGLKFGIHIIRGIPREAVEKNLPIAGSSFHAADAANTADTCRWNADNYGLKNNAAAQAYYDSIIKLYAVGASTISRSTASRSPIRRMRSTWSVPRSASPGGHRPEPFPWSNSDRAGRRSQKVRAVVADIRRYVGHLVCP